MSARERDRLFHHAAGVGDRPVRAKKVSRRDAERIRDLISSTFRAAELSGQEPMLFDHQHEGLRPGCWSIAMEGGVYDWPQLFPHGGRDEEYGISWPDVSGQLPRGVFLEPINNCILGVYPDA
jgi:hypothetical protein